MKELKGSKTYDNLNTAFAGESMAWTKYAFFASQAKKDGYEQIAAIFSETAENEKAHAKLWYKYMNGGSVGDTMTNLLIAAQNEHEEWSEMYRRFAQTAHGEGYNELAERFELIGAIEKTHEERYLTLLANVTGGKVFRRDASNVWVCRNCGHIHVGSEAPELCPACQHPRAFFQLRAENY